MTSMNITINFSFPDGFDQPGRVDTATTPSVASVARTIDTINWVPSVETPNPPAGFQVNIMELLFFTDATKTTRATPSYFTGNTNTDGSYTITIARGASLSEEVDWTYSIGFDDTIDTTEQIWDPTLKVLPRGKGAPPEMEAEATG